MIMDWLRKAPTAVVVTLIVMLGVVALGVVGAFVVLEINGVDTAPLRQWISAIGIPILTSLLGINTAATISAARSASNAEDQTNGQLTARDEKIAHLEARIKNMGGQP